MMYDPLPAGVSSAPRLLAISVVFPLAVAATAGWLSQEWQEIALHGGLIYAAIVLVFLGGSRCGRVMGRYPSAHAGFEIASSLLPAVAALLVLLLPQLPALCLLVATVLLQNLWDVLAVEEGRLPPGFGKFGTTLAVGMVISLLAMITRLLI